MLQLDLRGADHRLRRVCARWFVSQLLLAGAPHGASPRQPHPLRCLLHSRQPPLSREHVLPHRSHAPISESDVWQAGAASDGLHSHDALHPLRGLHFRTDSPRAGDPHHRLPPPTVHLPRLVRALLHSVRPLLPVQGPLVLLRGAVMQPIHSRGYWQKNHIVPGGFPLVRPNKDPMAKVQFKPCRTNKTKPCKTIKTPSGFLRPFFSISGADPHIDLQLPRAPSLRRRR
mmetsp:Transcript_63108/g.148657  ORF Transcript_63108/g.148657 Transcript_63108/m.148657 type:complete len:229 (+) Transcript_63108:239-925(+)